MTILIKNGTNVTADLTAGPRRFPRNGRRRGVDVMQNAVLETAGVVG